VRWHPHDTALLDALDAADGPRAAALARRRKRMANLAGMRFKCPYCSFDALPFAYKWRLRRLARVDDCNDPPKVLRDLPPAQVERLLNLALTGDDSGAAGGVVYIFLMALYFTTCGNGMTRTIGRGLLNTVRALLRARGFRRATPGRRPPASQRPGSPIRERDHVRRGTA
jgi:hypothetical protein